MSQTAVQPHQLHSMIDAGDDRSSSQPSSRQPSRELLTAWLLLLLHRGATHGYELRRQLESYGVCTEAGSMYRLLRKLESEGCAASSWAKSAAGPRRRLYQLTAKGRRDLDGLVMAIAVARDVHAAFLEAHQAAAG
ncbi:MAG TPA: helix-turn-helix transcriptional regulator [Solirubrobacteraceae bacterium]|nr:helix-turn-helix transcriptional regulator [Solirubrobacteraceae bacterium]